MQTTTKLFRAERVREPLLRGDPRHRRATQRLPVNVPFIIDNLWEYLRPTHMPCRRHAVFASPSPALALTLASSSSTAAQSLGVYEVVISGPVKIAQLQVRDARFHPDIAQIIGMLPKRIAALGAGGSERQSAALLFLPGATQQEWTELASTSGAVASLIAEMTALSTFWTSASETVAHSEGEVFFELAEGSSFSPRNLLYGG